MRLARTCFYTLADEPTHDMRFLQGPGVSSSCLFLVQSENKKEQKCFWFECLFGQNGECACVCVCAHVCVCACKYNAIDHILNPKEGEGCNGGGRQQPRGRERLRRGLDELPPLTWGRAWPQARGRLTRREQRPFRHENIIAHVLWPLSHGLSKQL